VLQAHSSLNSFDGIVCIHLNLIQIKLRDYGVTVESIFLPKITRVASITLIVTTSRASEACWKTFLTSRCVSVPSVAKQT
jgi:hypothetical protein